MRKMILLAIAAALSVSACSSSGGGGGYDQFCVDYLTGIRFPDYYCIVGNPNYLPIYRPYYVQAGYPVPRVGAPAPHFNKVNLTKPKSVTIHTGIPTTGGKRYNTRPTVKRFQPKPITIRKR